MAAIAPMDLVMKSDPASIPLKCTLCPKKPNFSDVSHLLTHISSKSHLSHRFRTELKSHTERDARDAIRHYDDWYNGYGIRALLAERMAAKEQKKTNKRGRPSQAAGSKSQGRHRHAPSQDDDVIKIEPEEYDGMDPEPMASQWATGSHPTFQTAGSRRGFPDRAYLTPVMKRTLSDYSVPGTPDNTARMRYQRDPSETESVLASEIAESVEDEGEASKLKGVKYPGMGLFDSANEQQKRKRNQRKDDSVLKLMEMTSSGIVPTEFVWEGGEIQRTRYIYDSPSIEGSPKKRARRTTVASTNTGSQRPTRYSTRLAQNKAGSKNNGAINDGFDEDEHDTSQVSRHSHASMDNYDVFSDHPHPSPGHMGSPLEEAGFELRRRSALHPMQANVPTISPALKPDKPLPYFPPRDNGHNSFPTHHPIPSSGYFQQQQQNINANAGNFNPLFVQRNGYLHHYGYANYGSEPKPPTTGFQPINMNQPLLAIPFNSYGNPYTSNSPHQSGTADFDM
ncbi:hypothetical protein B0H67DRAFT_87764 [Lasiosphaeris hirsuta]|uniref:Uncharacterized protein n=1 Tax=Lasiosphaeris hirsuta TaxID=260670 RepID=A0AA40BCL1_9PEZI|nr:hypothetical protein B0H67DRAFT_87764 [Lasiosphaeris hirsuta]